MLVSPVVTHVPRRKNIHLVRALRTAYGTSLGWGKAQLRDWRAEPLKEHTLLELPYERALVLVAELRKHGAQVDMPMPLELLAEEG